MSIKLQTDIGTELMAVAKSAKFHSMLGVEQVATAARKMTSPTTRQDFVCGNDTDKNSEFIEDLMCQQEPVMKVRHVGLAVRAVITRRCGGSCACTRSSTAASRPKCLRTTGVCPAVTAACCERAAGPSCATHTASSTC